MKKVETLITRLQKIDIQIELLGNYPWIYLDKVNGKRVTEKFHSDHGFTIAFHPIRVGEELKFTDLGEIFKVIRKYKKDRWCYFSSSRPKWNSKIKVIWSDGTEDMIHWTKYNTKNIDFDLSCRPLKWKYEER